MNIARRLYIGACVAFLVLLPIQFALAGMGIMGGSLRAHIMFGGMVLHLLIPLVLVLSALAGRLGRSFALAGLGLFVLLTLQIAVIDLGGDLGSPLIKGLHPAIALLAWPYVYLHAFRPAREAAAAEVQPAADDAAPVTP